MDDIDIISGKELQTLIRKKRIRNKDIQDALGIHHTTISRYFNDYVTMPASFLLKTTIFIMQYLV